MTLQRRTRLRSSSPPKRAAGLKRSGRIRPINRKRKARLFAEDFGSVEYVKHLHQFPCANCEVYGWTVAAHLKSRGAGGKVDDLVPLCGSRFLGTAAAVTGCHEKWDDHQPELRQHSLRFNALAKKLRNEFPGPRTKRG